MGQVETGAAVCPSFGVNQPAAAMYPVADPQPRPPKRNRGQVSGGGIMSHMPGGAGGRDCLSCPFCPGLGSFCQFGGDFGGQSRTGGVRVVGSLRDYLLSDAVEKTHYGRAYGLERAADMIGAVAGPLTATLLVYLGIEFKSIILLALAPGVLAAAFMLFMARERVANPTPAGDVAANAVKAKFPRAFWLFLVGVLLFGLGDFSRTFLILIAAGGLKENGRSEERRVGK